MRLQIIDGGHVVHVDNPQVFNAAVKDSFTASAAPENSRISIAVLRYLLSRPIDTSLSALRIRNYPRAAEGRSYLDRCSLIDNLSV
jgi:hypothetical protein